MKITIEIDGKFFDERTVPDAVDKAPQEQDEYINVMCKPLGDGTLRSLVSGTIYRPVDEQDQPSCKARRFLLVDGETADITECVKWGNGRVTIEPPYDTGTYTFPSWDRFKETYPGCGVQWIDQEVSE